MTIEKVEKLYTNIHDKTELCYSHKKFQESIKSCIHFEKKVEYLQ